MSNVNMDFEQAGELKIGQVGIATLRIRTLNVPRLIQEMSDRVTRAQALQTHCRDPGLRRTPAPSGPDHCKSTGGRLARSQRAARGHCLWDQ